MKELIEAMDKSILCLAIELPASVHYDVAKKWRLLKDALIPVAVAFTTVGTPCNGCAHACSTVKEARTHCSHDQK